MKRSLIIGVMGGGTATVEDAAAAYDLGRLIAKQGWVLLNGGRNSGIMEASARGASEHGGITVGILPDADHRRVSEYIAIPVVTGMGSARNSINILSSDVVVACPGGPGTLSETALALKYNKPLILFNFKAGNKLAVSGRSEQVQSARTAKQVIEIIKIIVSTAKVAAVAPLT